MSVKRTAGIAALFGVGLLLILHGCRPEPQDKAGAGPVVEDLGHDYPVQPVAFTDVKLTDQFWRPRIETNRTVSIPYAFGKCEETGRIDNFSIAGGLMEGEHKGDYPFDDTDAYKILEGASYSLSVHPDPKLEEYLDDLIARIAAAQEDDGYLFTCRTNKCERLRRWFGNERWEKLEGSHELYNMGHLYEAAVAHYRATGKRTLLEVATKNADFLCTVFGPGRLEKAPGHQVIEMGLAKLYVATGDERYLKLAKFFLDTRGPDGNPYNQSHKKVVEQDEAVGHAVRASYMYSGMADVAALTGDMQYLEAINRIWDNVVGRKLYLTGGIGATGSGEAFGKDYELPNETAYCETCAAIGNVMWNHRMFLFEGDAKYIDVLERTLYNGVISGVSLSGDLFFYPNPLASRGQHKRSPWFGCACCPGNITRFIASVPGYVYARSGDRLYVNLFVDGSGKVAMGRNTVRIEQKTQYPWDGAVRMTVEPQRAGKFTLCVRIPGWAQNRPVPSDLYRYADKCEEKAGLKVNGKDAAYQMEKGFACIERKWGKGDVVELNLPMPVRRVVAHEKVEADSGRVALERGPLVYCAEWPDNEGKVLNLVLKEGAKLTTEFRGDLLNGVAVITGKAMGLSYGPDGTSTVSGEREFTAIPYYAWAHRGQGQMAVWLAGNESEAEPTRPQGTIGNPSFEEGDDNRPANWRTQVYSGRADFKYAEGGRTGMRYVMIASEEGADAGWLTSADIKPRAQYRLSGWIKTENLDAGSGKGALFNLHNIQPVQTPAVTGTKDWTRVEVVFDTGDHTVVEINCLFGGWGRSTGKAWFDDVKLELLSTKGVETRLEIDAGKTGEPVSKYIYGQFIEHLGRCIYGGIWAEMLEDRKFYYLVGARQSPWKAVGGSDAVKMERANSYVGEQTPEVSLAPDAPCGIVQGRLALIEGKDYVGRVVLAGDAGAKVKVSLAWGPGEDERQSVMIDAPGADYTKTPLKFTSGGSTEDGRLEIVATGTGKLRIGTASLMPADNIKGMRVDTLNVLKELDAPIYRWPGGNFVSGYDWRDGIGDPDRRPPRKNPAWRGVEHNDFGLHEYLAFCEAVGAEPLITVNSGFGDDHSAAEELEYVNGSADTPMGRWRAENGHPEPYGAKLWCVGNEMFGSWQLGYMSLDHYILKHNLFAKAMWEVDPTIKLIGVGAVGNWSEGMLKSCADHMEYLSEHFYRQEQRPVAAHVRQIPESVSGIVRAHRGYRERLDSLKGKDIRVAIDEWNYWYGPHVYGELGTRYFLKDALGIAAGLHEMIRNSDIVFMANYAQTVNVIGCIKTSKTAAAFATTGLPLKLYRRRFGTIPVEVGGDSWPLDVAAAWTSDRRALTIGVVNPMAEEVEAPIDLKGAKLTGKGRLWLITHPDPMAYNEPGKEPKVLIREITVSRISDKLRVPALSISLFELPVR